MMQQKFKMHSVVSVLGLMEVSYSICKDWVLLGQNTQKDANGEKLIFCFYKAKY